MVEGGLVVWLTGFCCGQDAFILVDSCHVSVDSRTALGAWIRFDILSDSMLSCYHRLSPSSGPIVGITVLGPSQGRDHARAKFARVCGSM